MLYVSLNRCTASARVSRQRTQILDILPFRAHYLNSTLGAKPRALVRLWFLLRRWRVDVFAFIVAVSGMARVRSVGVSAPRNPRDLCGHVHLEHAAGWHGRHRRGYRSSTKEHGVVALGLIKCVKCDVRCTFNILYFSVERCIGSVGLMKARRSVAIQRASAYADKKTNVTTRLHNQLRVRVVHCALCTTHSIRGAADPGLE